MALTRKEKLLKAILEDNPQACRGGVTREERILAGVGRNLCEVTAADAPQPFMQLVTDANGETMWAERNGYKTIGEVVFLEGDYLYPYSGTIYNHYGYSTSQSFIEGKVYNVTFNGTVFECVAKSDENGFFMGNEALRSSNAGEDTGEPFLLTNMEPGSAVFCYVRETSDSHFLSVSGPGEVTLPIPGEYVAGGLFKGEGSNSTQMKDCDASGMSSIALGEGTKAGNLCSVAVGYNTKALSAYSFAEGQETIANVQGQHVQGKYNIEDEDGKFAHIVGNGKREYGKTTRSNAYTLDWSGNGWFAGTVEGTGVIVKSSTEGSTKKFMITVDDTGAITATEVTD